MAGVAPEFLDQLEQKFPTLSQFPGLLKLVGESENLGQPGAVSRKGAVGEFQNMPATAADPGFGVPPYDPHDKHAGAVGAAGLLNAYITKLGNVRDGIVAYKWGIGNVQRLGADKAPAETLAQANAIVEKLTGSAAKVPVPMPPIGDTPTPMGIGPAPMPEIVKGTPAEVPIVEQPQPFNAIRGLKAYEETPGGAVTGMAVPRLRGADVSEITPAQGRMIVEGLGAFAGGTAGVAAGGAAGFTLGSMAAPPLGGIPAAAIGATAGGIIGEGVGTYGASRLANIFDPVANPHKEAAISAGMMMAGSAVTRGAMVGLRKLIAEPSRASRTLIDMMEAEGKIPPMGTALPNGLARMMQSVGAADIFAGYKVKQAVEETGLTMTKQLNDYIVAFRRYKDSADAAFDIVDTAIKNTLGPQKVAMIPRGVVEPVLAAEKAFQSAYHSDQILPEIRRIVDFLNTPMGPHSTGMVPMSIKEMEVLRTLFYQQGRAYSGKAVTENTAVGNATLARASYEKAGILDKAIEKAMDDAVRDGKLPISVREMAVMAKADWRVWKEGQVIEDVLGAKTSVGLKGLQPIKERDILAGLQHVEQVRIDSHYSLLSEGTQDRLYAIAHALRAVEQSEGATTMSMAVRNIQLFGAGGITFAKTGSDKLGGTEQDWKVGGLVMVLSPAVLGFIVRNPHATDMLIKGLRTPEGSATGLRATRELLTLLAKERLLSPTERPQQ